MIPPIFKGELTNEVGPFKNDWLLYSNVMEQFFTKERIFCSHKILCGENPHCKNNNDCSINNVDYPYSKCEEPFIELLNYALGDVNKLVTS